MDGSDSDRAALDVIREYLRDFETLEARAVARHCNQPCLFIAPQGVTALASSADVERFFTPVMADLRAQGYRSSEFPRLVEHRLSATTALVTGIGIWKKQDGQELRRFGVTYTLTRTPAPWRIAVLAIHDPQTPLLAPG